MQRISIEELLKRNIRGAIVMTGRAGIAVVQVERFHHDGDDIQIVTGRTARMNGTTGEWRRVPTTRQCILAESRVLPFTMPGSIGLLGKNGRSVCIRTDRAPIVSIRDMRAIPLPNFDTLV